MSSILHQVHWLTLILKSDIAEHAERHTECISLVLPIAISCIAFHRLNSRSSPPMVG